MNLLNQGTNLFFITFRWKNQAKTRANSRGRSH